MASIETSQKLKNIVLHSFTAVQCSAQIEGTNPHNVLF